MTRNWFKLIFNKTWTSLPLQHTMSWQFTLTSVMKDVKSHSFIKFFKYSCIQVFSWFYFVPKSEKFVFVNWMWQVNKFGILFFIIPWKVQISQSVEWWNWDCNVTSLNLVGRSMPDCFPSFCSMCRPCRSDETLNCGCKLIV